LLVALLSEYSIWLKPRRRLRTCRFNEIEFLEHNGLAMDDMVGQVKFFGKLLGIAA
jgi:hypothetical protein